MTSITLHSILYLLIDVAWLAHRTLSNNRGLKTWSFTFFTAADDPSINLFELYPCILFLAVFTLQFGALYDWFLVPIGIISTIQTFISAFYLLIHTSKQVSFYLLWAYRHRQLIRVEPPDKIFSKHLNDFYLSTLYQVYSIFSVGKIKKKFPSSRIWTSDLWISLLPLQSTALPTELSTVGR